MTIAIERRPNFLLAAVLLIMGWHGNPVVPKPRQEGQANHSTPAKLACSDMKETEKPKERKMTAAEEANFVGPAVRNYVRTQRRMPSAGAIVLPPPEFTVVVNAGKDAIPFLLRSVSGDDAEVREAAAEALALITNRSFVDFQVLLGGKQDPQEWKLAAAKYQEWWQGHRNSPRVDWLVEDTTSQSLPQRRSAILQLAGYDNSESREALRKCLLDPSVQIDAASSLAKLGDRAAIPVLVDVLLPHQNPSVRREGICLLQSLTGETFGFDPDAPASSRSEAINRWRLWAQQHHATDDNPTSH